MKATKGTPGRKNLETETLGFQSVLPCQANRRRVALLGIWHQAFSVKFQGLDVRLTGVEEAHVLERILT